VSVTEFRSSFWQLPAYIRKCSEIVYFSTNLLVRDLGSNIWWEFPLTVPFFFH
jgi:hypothetical protein